jgi:hypothetical protein
MGVLAYARDCGLEVLSTVRLELPTHGALPHGRASAPISLTVGLAAPGQLRSSLTGFTET